MSKSLLHSARVTVGNKMYIAGKKRKTYNVVKNTGCLKTAGVIKINKNRIAALRKGVKSNNLFWHTETVKIKPEVNTALKTKPQSKKSNASGNFSSQMATDIKDSIKNYTDSQGDSGTSTISTAIKAGEIGIKSFKAAETASPVVVNTIRRTGKGIYKVGRTTVKVANTIDRTAGKVILGTVKLNPETMKYFRKLAFDRAKQSGLIKSAVSQIQDVRENVVKIKNNVMTAKRYTANTVKFIGAVLDGTVAVRFTREQLKTDGLYATVIFIATVTEFWGFI